MSGLPDKEACVRAGWSLLCFVVGLHVVVSVGPHAATLQTGHPEQRPAALHQPGPETLRKDSYVSSPDPTMGWGYHP